MKSLNMRIYGLNEKELNTIHNTGLKILTINEKYSYRQLILKSLSTLEELNFVVGKIVNIISNKPRYFEELE